MYITCLWLFSQFVHSYKLCSNHLHACTSVSFGRHLNSIFLQGCRHCHGCCRVCASKFHRNEQTLGSHATSGWFTSGDALSCSHTWTYMTPHGSHVIWSMVMTCGPWSCQCFKFLNSYGLWSIHRLSLATICSLICRVPLGIRRSEKRKEVSFVIL